LTFDKNIAQLRITKGKSIKSYKINEPAEASSLINQKNTYEKLYYFFMLHFIAGNE